MFSEAINSISSRWRPSSFATTSAMSGSTSASDPEKRASISPTALGFDVADIAISWRREFSAPNDEKVRDLAPEIAYRHRTAKHWAVERSCRQHIEAVSTPQKKSPSRKAAGAISKPLQSN